MRLYHYRKKVSIIDHQIDHHPKEKMTATL